MDDWNVGLNKGLNQSAGMEFPIRMFLGHSGISLFGNRVSKKLCFV